MRFYGVRINSSPEQYDGAVNIDSNESRYACQNWVDDALKAVRARGYLE